MRHGLGDRGGAGVIRDRTQPYVCCRNSRGDQPIPRVLGVLAQIVRPRPDCDLPLPLPLLRVNPSLTGASRRGFPPHPRQRCCRSRARRARAGRWFRSSGAGRAARSGKRLKSAKKERRRVGGHSRRRSPLGLVRPDRDRQARRSYAAGGQRNVSRGGGAYSRGWKPPISAPAPRYRLTPKSCPTRAGRLKRGNVAGHAQQPGPIQG